MSGIIQRIKTVLIPEIGLDLEPDFVEEFEVSTEFTRVLAHLVGKVGSRSILLEATTDGKIIVASSGTANEIYLVENGNAPDAYNAGNTYDQVDAINITDILIENNGATISFRNAAGVYGDGKALPVGAFSLDFIHYGIRIQNRVALAVAAYEFTMYR